MREKLWRAAFAQTLPVLAGYLFLGFAYGVLMRHAGFSPLWAVGMSIFVYAGSMQYAAVPVLAGAFDPDVYKRQELHRAVGKRLLHKAQGYIDAGDQRGADKAFRIVFHKRYTPAIRFWPCGLAKPQGYPRPQGAVGTKSVSCPAKLL